MDDHLELTSLRALGDTTRDLITRLRAFSTAPEQRKSLQKTWRTGDVARLLGVSDTHVRSFDAALGRAAEHGSGHRRYSLAEIQRLRELTGRQAWRAPGDPCVRIAVSNFKGGVGKTTCATNLAAHLTLRGYRTLFIDLDPQGSSTALLYPDNDLLQITQAMTVYPALMGDPNRLQQAITSSAWTGLDIVPATLSLYAAELELPQRTSDQPGFFYWERLDQALAAVESAYDLILIDTPPSLSHLTVNAAWAATGLVVPVQASMMDLQAMAAFFYGLWESMHAIVAAGGGGKQLAFLRVVISNYRGNPRTQIDEYTVAGWMRQMYGRLMAESPILNSSAIRSAANNIQIVYEVNPKRSDAAHARSFASFETLGDELAGLIDQQWPSRRR